MDLFKFFTDDLHSRLSDDKKIIKEILKVFYLLLAKKLLHVQCPLLTFVVFVQEASFDVEIDTVLSDFVKVIAKDSKRGPFDKGNLKLAFDSVSACI